MVVCHLVHDEYSGDRALHCSSTFRGFAKRYVPLQVSDPQNIGEISTSSLGHT